MQACNYVSPSAICIRRSPGVRLAMCIFRSHYDIISLCDHVYLGLQNSKMVPVQKIFRFSDLAIRCQAECQLLLFCFKFVTNFKMPMVDNLCLVFPLSVQVGMCVSGWANSELPVRL